MSETILKGRFASARRDFFPDQGEVNHWLLQKKKGWRGGKKKKKSDDGGECA